MSGFERLIGSGKRDLTPGEGFTGLALCAVGADRHVDEEEVKEVAKRLHGLDAFSGFGKVKLVKCAKKVLEIYDERGHQELLDRSVDAIPGDRAEEAFETTVAILAADRRVTDEEQKMMDRIQRELGLERKRAESIRREHGVGSAS